MTSYITNEWDEFLKDVKRFLKSRAFRYYIGGGIVTAGIVAGINVYNTNAICMGLHNNQMAKTYAISCLSVGIPWNLIKTLVGWPLFWYQAMSGKGYGFAYPLGITKPYY